MRSARFEWDDDKDRANIVKHKIDFDDAKLVFDDAGIVDDPDDTMDYGEDRYRAVGMVKGKVIAVFYTLRHARIRIITARKATHLEQVGYAEQNPPR
jgi:uncharacterized protein